MYVQLIFLIILFLLLYTITTSKEWNLTDGSLHFAIRAGSLTIFIIGNRTVSTVKIQETET